MPRREVRSSRPMSYPTVPSSGPRRRTSTASIRLARSPADSRSSDSCSSRARSAGASSQRDRNEVLREQLPAWQALFEIKEFRFAEVMRASVLPALDARAGTETAARRASSAGRRPACRHLPAGGPCPDPAKPAALRAPGIGPGPLQPVTPVGPGAPRADGSERWASASASTSAAIGSAGLDRGVLDAMRARRTRCRPPRRRVPRAAGAVPGPPRPVPGPPRRDR